MKGVSEKEYKLNAAMWKLANAWIHHYYPQHCKCHFHRRAVK